MDEAAIQTKLQEMRNQLLALSEASENARSAVALDQTKVGRLSRMDALQQQAMDKAIEARRQTDLKRIDAALRRLAHGEYGYCLRCGEDIAEQRLALDPTATICTGCATENTR